jgi:hypothetical protein
MDDIKINMWKFFEVVKCECGHECPIVFAIIDDDANYTCPNCHIDYLNDLLNDRKTKPVKALKSICSKNKIWIDCDEIYDNCGECPFKIK